MKLQKISTQVNPFAGISFVQNEFVKVGMCQLIDNEIQRRVKTVVFSYSDIIKNLVNVFYSGGDCAEIIYLQAIRGTRNLKTTSFQSGLK